MILTDNETRVDMLNNRAIANTIVKLINESANQPISIGVHGDWGAGKSSILAMIEEQFPSRKNDSIVCIRFNGWKHQGFEDSKIALMSAILSEITRRRKMSEKAKDVAKKLWKNINWISVAKTVGSVAVSAATGVPPINMLTGLVDKLRSDVTDGEKISGAIECVGNYLNEAKVFEDVSLSKEFAEFQKSFDALLKETKIKKLIVLIDDLDRCLPEVTIETLEAVRLFLFSNSTAFVIAADEAMIEYAVGSYFPDYPTENDQHTGYEYSKRYLEKLIQVPFRIPVLGKVESEMYTAMLMIGSVLDESDANFKNVLNIAIDRMKKPWENNGFTLGDIQTALGDKYAQAAEAFSVANQIADILSKNTQGNPRKIKRFINMLLLRREIAEARGFGASIQLPIMAKMMLAEQFHAGEYKTIATLLDEEGKCIQLAEFEKSIASSEKNTERETQDTVVAMAVERGVGVTPSENKKDAHITDWGSKLDFCSWALSEPQLGNEDLRPYFFACKGAEDYFFAQTQNEAIRQLISKLMGNTMAVASAVPEIKELNTRDAKYVFDILARKIQQAGALADKPRGIDGVITLVEHHDTLEQDLVKLILVLDVGKVGAWVCTGWDKCIRKENEKKQLEGYYRLLAEKGTAVTKIAAKSRINE
ncbi:MAG: hypothetical protein J6A88_00500 [Oscillospiraceae bacterium]|nr:hypothetical protein [Oscillospiraceae bacterium]